MKFHIIILTILFSAFLHGCEDEKKTQPVATTKENSNPRLIDLNPNSWKNLPMKLVISDFQESDGISSSFICDEITKRLSTEPLKSLQSMEEIDKESRVYAFNNCFSPEGGDPSRVLKSVSIYAKDFPVLISEIKNATKRKQ